MKGSFDSWLRTAVLGGMVAGGFSMVGAHRESLTDLSSATVCIWSGDSLQKLVLFCHPVGPGDHTQVARLCNSAVSSRSILRVPVPFFQMEQVFSPYSICI